MRVLLVTALTVLFLPRALSAHTNPAGTLPASPATRTEGAIRLDGRLDENDWAKAPVTEAFTQLEPDEGKPGSQRTEVRVVYDGAFLYVGAQLFDDGRVTGRLGRRDMDPGDSDWFRVFVDSYHDHRTAFGFEVNPAGVRRDEFRTIDADDNTWDPVWDVATRQDSAGWVVEMRIPYGQLRFSSAPEQTWGVQFERVIGRNRETVQSTYTPKSERGGVPLYGHLTDLRGIRSGRRFEILPYTLARSSYVDPGSNPFAEDPEHSLDAGLDLLYGVGSNLTLNAAFNPDFGQVEVDPAVVNLGVYETFFEEKRPFFIEGSEIFDFGAQGTSAGQVFYSRRIGRAPTLGPPTFESDVPEVTTILGAGKLSGKVGSWSIGVLEAVTAKEEARYNSPTVLDGRFALEPLSNYFVGRTRREWRGGQSILGGILTSANRDLSSPQLESALHKNAYAGGVDFYHEWGKRAWAVWGDAEMSRVEGSRSAIIATQRRSNHFFQRPDADHLEVDTLATAMNGYSMNLQMRKQAGAHWRGRFGTALTSPKYEVNDLGFSYRTDRRDFLTNVQYLENKPGKFLRSWNSSLTGRLERNYDWQPILSFTTFEASGTTLGYWSLYGNVIRYFRANDDRLTRGGPLAIRPAWWSQFAQIASDGRKPVTVTFQVGGNRTEFDGWDWNTAVAIGLKTSSRWNLTMRPTFFRGHGTAQYVATDPDAGYTGTYGPRYIFAPLDQTSVGLETRFNMTFTPRLSLETYIQPLISSGDYGDPIYLVAPRTYEFAPHVDPVPNRDFNYRSLRGNAVLRWEWRPGSTLYLAWQQSREDYAAGTGDFRFDRDRQALFDTKPDDIFLLKINYWLSP